MSEIRRAEIEAKRLRLAELRQARADRQKLDTDRKTSVSAQCGGFPCISLPSTVRITTDC